MKLRKNRLVLRPNQWEIKWIRRHRLQLDNNLTMAASFIHVEEVEKNFFFAFVRSGAQLAMDEK
jgi:hypothetical protein